MFEKAMQNWIHHNDSCCTNVDPFYTYKMNVTYIRCYNMIEAISFFPEPWPEIDTTLITLLHDQRHRLCSDDRDKIFGLLGLVTNWLGTDLILADYDLDVRSL